MILIYNQSTLWIRFKASIPEDYKSSAKAMLLDEATKDNQVEESDSTHNSSESANESADGVDQNRFGDLLYKRCN